MKGKFAFLNLVYKNERTFQENIQASTKSSNVWFQRSYVEENKIIFDEDKRSGAVM